MDSCRHIPKGCTIVFSRSSGSCFLLNWHYYLDIIMTIYTLEFEVEDDEVIEQVVEFLQEKFPHLNMEFYQSAQDEYLQ
jgi:hypothetical protein